jgi:hypothetical protein
MSIVKIFIVLSFSFCICTINGQEVHDYSQSTSIVKDVMVDTINNWKFIDTPITSAIKTVKIDEVLPPVSSKELIVDTIGIVQKYLPIKYGVELNKEVDMNESKVTSKLYTIPLFGKFYKLKFYEYFTIVPIKSSDFNSDEVRNLKIVFKKTVMDFDPSFVNKNKTKVEVEIYNNGKLVERK